MKLKNIIWVSLLSFLVISGCQIFPPRNIETVVVENYISYWRLSPTGEYLAYGSPRGEGNFLLDISTGQEHEFNCSLHWWDKYLIGCYGANYLSVIDVKTLAETPLTLIDLTKETEMDKAEYANELFVKQLLANAEKIYRLERFTRAVYILAPNYQLNPDENYIIWGLKQPDELLAQYPVINVPSDSPGSRNHEETYSPNGLYYYGPPFDALSIFKTDTNEKLAEFSTEEAHLDVLGWAIDSSGVYFTEYSVGFIGSGKPEAIYKLKVPND